MKKEYEIFKEYLDNEKKEDALQFVISLLEEDKIGVVDLYTHILTPALNAMECNLADRRICVWREHVRTAIVRTVVECCFPYVIKKKNQLSYESRGTVVVLCPPEEYHDLGARMSADFFTICGWNAVFVGSNTPYLDFYNAIDVIKPDIVAISVSNYYNLVSTKKIISELKLTKNKNLKIVVGGYAFDKNLENVEMVGADYYAHTFNDIEKIVKQEVEKCD